MIHQIEAYKEGAESTVNIGVGNKKIKEVTHGLHRSFIHSFLHIWNIFYIIPYRKEGILNDMKTAANSKEFQFQSNMISTKNK